MEEESGGGTVDIEPEAAPSGPSAFSNPVVLILAIVAGISVLANIALAVLYFMR